MNYYIYYVGGDSARNYLGNTNYVGVWADTQLQALDKVRKNFAKGTSIVSVARNQVNSKIGYLY